MAFACRRLKGHGTAAGVRMSNTRRPDAPEFAIRVSRPSLPLAMITMRVWELKADSLLSNTRRSCWRVGMRLQGLRLLQPRQLLHAELHSWGLQGGDECRPVNGPLRQRGNGNDVYHHESKHRSCHRPNLYIHAAGQPRDIDRCGSWHWSGRRPATSHRGRRIDLYAYAREEEIEGRTVGLPATEWIQPPAVYEHVFAMGKIGRTPCSNCRSPRANDIT